MLILLIFWHTINVVQTKIVHLSIDVDSKNAKLTRVTIRVEIYVGQTKIVHLSIGVDSKNVNTTRVSVRVEIYVGQTTIVHLSIGVDSKNCLLYTSPSPRDQRGSRMPSSA